MSILNFSKAAGSSVSWAMGYVALATGQLPSQSPKVSLSTEAFVPLIILAIVIVVLGIIIGLLLFRHYCCSSMNSTTATTMPTNTLDYMNTQIGLHETGQSESCSTYPSILRLHSEGRSEKLTRG
ncbi:unnamed protein product [Protopolystoma xenopodis]|uniref:Uncharacterized protein n=1 Tax=Protopolystoma xenopodis TaxID=117903 RepID=A0A448XCS6_9PLAT|nr:unnamed protein product [Protopolystoma xenopodis]